MLLAPGGSTDLPWTHLNARLRLCMLKTQRASDRARHRPAKRLHMWRPGPLAAIALCRSWGRATLKTGGDDVTHEAYGASNRAFMP